MSAGEFSLTRYESDTDEIHPIRVQLETVSANIGGANGPPGGAVTSDISVKVSRGAREYGIRPRFAVVRFTAGAPTGYRSGQLYRVPILTKARYNAINKGTTGTYLGEAVSVVSKIPESIR